MTVRPLRRVIAFAAALSASGAVAQIPDLSIADGLDLTAAPWTFEPGPEHIGLPPAELPVSSVTQTIALPGTLHSDSAEGTLTLSVPVANVPRSLQPVLSTELVIGDIRGSDQVRFNGEVVGSSSGMSISRTGIPRRYLIPSRAIRFGGTNEISIHVRGLGGDPDIRVGPPITLAALGPHELWAESAAIRRELERIAQTLWTAENEDFTDQRTVRRLFHTHRRVLERVVAAETSLSHGSFVRAQHRLQAAQDDLRGLDATVAPLRLALQDHRHRARATMVQEFSRSLTPEQRARGVTVRARPDGFGRWGLWLADGTDCLERVSPVEIRGRGAMGWHMVVDRLLAAQVADLSWMGKTSLVVGERGGRACDYSVSASLPFPGALLEQRAGPSAVFDLDAPVTEIGVRCVVSTPQGIRLTPVALGERGQEISALLIARRAERETLWLVVSGSPLLSVNLVALDPQRARLTLNFHRWQSKRFAVIPVHGVALSDTRWLGTAGDPPSGELEACAALLPLTRQFPLGLDEFYAVDREAGLVIVSDQFHHRPLKPETAPPARLPVYYPPLALLCADHGQPLSFQWNQRLDVATETFGGPIRADLNPQGVALWTMPLPSTDGRFHVRPPGQRDLVTMLNEHVTDLGTPTMPNGVDRTYKSRAQAYHAWAMLTPENRERVTANGRTMIPLTFDPSIWHEWDEPFSGIPTWYTYSIEGPAHDLYDQEWGNGLTLYALSLHAMIQDDWTAIRANRQTLDDMWAWWQTTDDWGWLRASNARHGHGTGAGDCTCADYAGALGRARLMEGLGDDAARDEALYLAARTALVLTGRFALTDWARQRGLIGEDEVALGFHEGEGYLTGAMAGYPWDATSMISGNGVEPEVFDLFFERDRDGLRRYEAEMLAANPHLFDGGHDYGRDTIYRGNSGYITLPHLYAQARLGASDSDLRRLLTAAQPNQYLWWLAPTVLAEMAGRDNGFWLADWSPGRLVDARMDSGGTAHVEFDVSRSPFRWRAHAEEGPSKVLINGFEVGEWTWDAATEQLTVETELTGNLDFTVAPR